VLDPLLGPLLDPLARETDPNSLAADPPIVCDTPLASHFLSEFQRSAVVERVLALVAEFFVLVYLFPFELALTLEVLLVEPYLNGYASVVGIVCLSCPGRVWQ
jgi:hypothetical protein